MTPSTTNTVALDKGPWHVGKDARDVFSADFTADVALRISGDFRDDEHKRQYAEWLVAALNFATLTQQQGGEQEADVERQARELLASHSSEGDEIVALKEVVSDLLSWFPDKPVHEWRLPAGAQGADDAIAAAKAAIGAQENE